MNITAYQQLLITAYESPGEDKQIALQNLFNFIQEDFSQFLQFNVDILSNSCPTTIKFLSTSLIRHIFQSYNESQVSILLQFSQPLFNSSFSLIQTEICMEVSALLAEILIFAFDNGGDINPIIEGVLSVFPQQTIQRGIFEMFNILCENIDLDPQIILFFLQFFSSNPNFTDDSDLISAIDLLSQISLVENFTIDEQMSTNLFSFLLNHLNSQNRRIKESIYKCFTKFCTTQLFLFIDIEILSQFILSDLSNGQCIIDISRLLKTMLKYQFDKFNEFLIKLLPILYSISISHQEIHVVDFGEEHSIDQFSALSVIESFLRFHPDQISLVVPFLNFDSAQPQIREISFRLLESIFKFAELNEETILLSLKAISVHIVDENRRVIESSLWALLAFCYEKVMPLEFVVDFFLKEGPNQLFDCLAIYFPNCEENEMEILSAISCEIFSIFAVENIYDCFEAIFNQLFQFHISLLNTNFEFIKIRIERTLIKLCSTKIESNILCHISQFLNEFVNSQSPVESEFNFLCELIDAYFTFNSQCNPELIPILLNDLQTMISSESISAITSLFLSQEKQFELDRSFLFGLFESNAEIAIDSIILFSIEHLDLSLLTNLIPLIDNKHQKVLIPLLEKVEQGNQSIDESNIQILGEIYDSSLFIDYIKLINAIVSNSDSSQPWMEFAFAILSSENDEIVNDSMIEIVQLFESFAAVDLETFQRFILERKLDSVLTAAFEVEEISQTAKVLLTMLQISE